MSIKNINDNYVLKSIYTNEIDSKDINDFIYVQNDVFSEKHTVNKFETKYLNNPYGDSLIILVYKDNECVASRAFWRNDLFFNEKYVESYQPCDSAVIENHRGKSLHKIMTQQAYKELEESAHFYSFPNDASMPTYKRMKWKLTSHLRYSLFNHKISYSSVTQVDSGYLNWLLSNGYNSKLSYTKVRGQYYLLKKRNKNIYVVIGKASSSIENKLDKALFPICLVYSTNGKIGRGLTIVGKNIEKNMSIPIYKMDTLF